MKLRMTLLPFACLDAVRFALVNDAEKDWSTALIVSVLRPTVWQRWCPHALGQRLCIALPRFCTF